MLLCHPSIFASIYKEYSMHRLLLLICSALFLGACSNFQSTSNVDKQHFNEYFIPSQVPIYEKNELLTLDYEVLGAVEGSSCQIKENDLPADIREARTKARVNAAALHANGISFQSCITFEPDSVCLSNIICYGRALDITPASKD